MVNKKKYIYSQESGEKQNIFKVISFELQDQNSFENLS